MRLFFLAASITVVLLGSVLSLRAQAPVINSFSPTTICQGEPLTITGSGFTGATAVKAGNIAASSYTVNDDNTITAVIAVSAGNGTVTVTTPHGMATGSTLTVKPAPQPGLTHVAPADAPFTNCNGSASYLITVSNSSSSVTGTGNTYAIDWGDGTPGFSQTDWPFNASTTHQYTAQGYFTITLTITPANGCVKSKTYQFYNGKNPIASFTTTLSTTGLCVPAPVEFQVGNWSTNSAGTTYQVDFGDMTPKVTLTQPLNGTGSIQLLNHTYNTTSCPNAVDFTATLQAINGCFTTTYTLNQIIIRKKPEADFNILTTPACINGPVCVSNQTTNGYSGNSCNTTATYSWDFGDGTPLSTLQAPSCHQYTTPGTYTIALSVSNTACGQSTKTKQVTVLPNSPPPTVDATPLVYCKGQVASPLTAVGTGLLWYTSATGGTGNPVAPTPSTSNAGTLTYYVSQTVAGNCESPRVPVTITVNPLPLAPGVGSPVQLCQGQPGAALTATGSGLLWYTSATGGVGSSTAPIPSTTAMGTTTYYVSQTNNSCEGPRAAIIVNVNVLPVAPVVTSPITYCQNQTAVPLGATGAGLLWYTDPTGGTGNPVAPTPSTLTAGTTTYYVSQATGCGESPRASITVNVNAPPSATISYTPSTFCNVVDPVANPPVPVTQTGDPGGIYSIVPAAGLSIDPATGELNPAGAVPGTYTIRYSLTGAVGCGLFTTTTTVTVGAAPTATISYPDLCTSDGVTAVRLTGTPGGTYSSTAGLTLDPSTGLITPGTSTPGMYTVTYTIAASLPCPGFVTTANLTITQAPTAAISYNPSVFCNVTDPAANPPVSVAQTGSPGGAYSIIPATGLSINPTTGELNPAGAVPGTYTVQYSVAGAGACKNYMTTTTVTVNNTPSAAIQYPAAPFCRAINTLQEVTISGNTGGLFSADPRLSINTTTGAINPSLSQPGLYTVTYTISPSPPCPGTITSTTVEIDDFPILTFALPVQSICSGGTALYTPSSNLANTTYEWFVMGSLPAGISGAAAGVSTGTDPLSLTFTNTGTSPQSLTIRVVPTNPSPNPCAGPPYDITLTVNPITPAPATDTIHFCMGDPATTLNVTPLPGTTLQWYDENFVLLTAAPVITTSTPATYTYYITQTNSTGCESPKTPLLAIVHPTPKIVSSSYTNPTSCGIPSGSIVLNVLDLNDNPISNLPLYVHYMKFQVPYMVLLSTDASGKITIPLTAGTYSNIYVEASGCVSQKIPDVFILKDPDPPSAPDMGYNAPLCSETPLTLTALSAASSLAGPVAYVWAGPAFGPFADTVRNSVITFPSASLSDAGAYIVYAIQNNCISLTTDLSVAIRQSPSKPVITTPNPLCIGDNLTLQAFSTIPPPDRELDYVWKGPGTGFPVNGSSAGIQNVKIEDGGIYSVTVTSPETGCSSTTDTLIRIGGYPILKFSQDTLSLPTGFLLNLSPLIVNAADPGILPIAKYEWTPSQDLTCNDAACSSPVALIKDNTCYNVKATNSFGCSGSAVICVKVFCQSSQVFIPNAFAPRGNLPENRILMVRASGISAVKSFRVFNRWGKIVFERNNFPPNSPDFGWDGMINGRLADPGVYVYTAEVICENGVPYTFKGNVTLL